MKKNDVCNDKRLAKTKKDTKCSRNYIENESKTLLSPRAKSVPF